MKAKLLRWPLLCLGIASISLAWAGPDESTADKIARAMLAAPSDISAKATIVDMDGTLLRKGTNDWVCYPGIILIPGDKHPMCNDPTWDAFFKAAKNGTEFKAKVIATSYMLQGDALVNNDNPAATDHGDGGMWVKDGPHIMMLFPDPAMIAHFPRNPYAGGPYVMWDNTPLMHVMFPVESKVKPDL